MHWPVGALQMWASDGHWALLVQAAWQVSSPGQHAGALAGQSALVLHTRHWPWMQYFAVAGQSASARQSTQPKVGSHFCVDLHALHCKPAAPPFAGAPLLPPQAMAIEAAANPSAIQL
jgi:hypothetical protein